MNPGRRYFAALRPERSVPRYVKSCTITLDKMSHDASYANPPIPYTVAMDHLAALAKADQSVRQNGAADRDAKLAIVQADMRQYKAYVQGLADSDLANAQVLIENAGMFASKVPTRSKQNLAARHGTVPGRVILDARAARSRASYHWQMRSGTAAWSDLPETLVATITVDGLTPATIVEFRLRILTMDGYSDWTAPVSIIVH